MRSTNKRGKRLSHQPLVKYRNYKRVAISVLLATVGLLAYSYAYQYTHQAKLEKQYNQVQVELQDKNKSLQRSAEEKAKLEKEKLDLQNQLQAKKAEQLRIASLVQQRASAASAPVSGTCAEWIAQAGISDVANAAELIRRESGCNPGAVNPISGACGVAQELPCGKSGCARNDGACQVKWMNRYVLGRYGSWASAIAWHNAHNWY